MNLNIYVDSNTSRTNPGPCAIGAIAFNSEGKELARSGRFIGMTTNNVGEWRAAIEGLALGLTIPGVTGVKIHTDSQLVQLQATGRYKVKAQHLRPLLHEWQLQVKEYPVPVTIHWIPREDNPAHDVADEYLTREYQIHEFDGVSPCL